MRTTNYTLEAVSEIKGLTDAPALSNEVATLRARLADVTEQMQVERELAGEIHAARASVIASSPALRQILVDSTDADAIAPIEEKLTMNKILRFAFGTAADTPALPKGFTRSTAKKLRVASHPDRGHDVREAQTIAGYLEVQDLDPVYVTAQALLARKNQENRSVQEMRDDRYALTIALSSSVPMYGDAKAAKDVADQEIKGADWRTRAIAAHECFVTIVGSDEALNSYMQGIAEEAHWFSIDTLNTYLPAVLSTLERIRKGDPKILTPRAIKDIDKVFERFAATFYDTEKPSISTPPYISWLPILLPALVYLDPGKKPGEDYTHFEAPIQIIERPARDLYDGKRDIFGGQKNEYGGQPYIYNQ